MPGFVPSAGNVQSPGKSVLTEQMVPPSWQSALPPPSVLKHLPDQMCTGAAYEPPAAWPPGFIPPSFLPALEVRTAGLGPSQQVGRLPEPAGWPHRLGQPPILCPSVG